MHTNQRLLVDLLLSKGAKVRLLDKHEELLEVTYRGKKEFLLDRFSSQMPFHVVKMTADKHFTKQILSENNIRVPKGSVFTGNSFHEALVFGSQIYPLVLKPNWGSHGDSIQVDIKNEKELRIAIDCFIKNNGYDTAFILEEFYPWKEFRLFITELGDFAVIHREWASIIGNGFSSIEDLIAMENSRRIKLKQTEPTALCPIVIDDEVHRYLKKSGRTINCILEEGQKTYLRQESNLAKGGRAINMTKEMPKIFKDIAKKSLACFPGLKMAGLDLLCDDIHSSNPQYVILEVNSSPGFAMHTYPTEGESVNVAQYVLDVMFKDFFK